MPEIVLTKADKAAVTKLQDNWTVERRLPMEDTYAKGIAAGIERAAKVCESSTNGHAPHWQVVGKAYAELVRAILTGPAKEMDCEHFWADLLPPHSGSWCTKCGKLREKS